MAGLEHRVESEVKGTQGLTFVEFAIRDDGDGGTRRRSTVPGEVLRQNRA